MITLPDEVDGHRVRVGCDVVAIEDVQDSLAAFGDRYLRKVFTASEINDCRGRNPGAQTGGKVRGQGSGDQGIRRTRHAISMARDRGNKGRSAAAASSERSARRAGTTPRLAQLVFVAFTRRLPRNGRRSRGL
jgi:hypothetical protein